MCLIRFNRDAKNVPDISFVSLLCNNKNACYLVLDLDYYYSEYFIITANEIKSNKCKLIFVSIEKYMHATSFFCQTKDKTTDSLPYIKSLTYTLLHIIL